MCASGFYYNNYYGIWGNSYPYFSGYGYGGYGHHGSRYKRSLDNVVDLGQRHHDVYSALDDGVHLDDHSLYLGHHNVPVRAFDQSRDLLRHRSVPVRHVRPDSVVDYDYGNHDLVSRQTDFHGLHHDQDLRRRIPAKHVRPVSLVDYDVDTYDALPAAVIDHSHDLRHHRVPVRHVRPDSVIDYDYGNHDLVSRQTDFHGLHHDQVGLRRRVPAKHVRPVSLVDYGVDTYDARPAAVIDHSYDLRHHRVPVRSHLHQVVQHRVPVNHQAASSLVGLNLHERDYHVGPVFGGHDFDHQGLVSRGQVHLNHRVPVLSASLLGHGLNHNNLVSHEHDYHVRPVLAGGRGRHQGVFDVLNRHSLGLGQRDEIVNIHVPSGFTYVRPYNGPLPADYNPRAGGYGA